MKSADLAALDFSAIRRIAIMGNSASGKSTLARNLGDVLGIEPTHLDRIFWMPGWVERPTDEFRALVDEVSARDEWIIDGNYTKTIGPRLERAQLFILMDTARRCCVWNALHRYVTHRGKTRPDMPNGITEKIDLEFLRWIWDYDTRRAKYLALLEPIADRTPVLILGSRAESARFIDAVRRRVARNDRVTP